MPTPITGPITGAWSVWSARNELSDDSQDIIANAGANGDIELDAFGRVGAAALGADDVDDLRDISLQAFDDASDVSLPSPDDLFPWWTKYAVAGLVLIAILAVLSPYADIAAGVAG